MTDHTERLRHLPSVDRLLQASRASELLPKYGREQVVNAIRAELDACRRLILASHAPDVRRDSLLDRVAKALDAKNQSSLRPVINASGVIIHTNLGRALLSVDARKAMTAVAGAYNTLEYDLAAGARGSRFTHARDPLRDLTGAEDAIVVNNNAAALALILSALAQSREVIISRGQLVEIGGGFRIPDIMAQTGAKLVEVGTTNRTRIGDFRNAITENAAMLLRVHASNFKQIGFVQQPTPAELTACAAELASWRSTIWAAAASSTRLNLAWLMSRRSRTASKPLRSHLLQRRQTARRTSSRHHHRQVGSHPTAEESSSGARAARRQTGLCRAHRHIAPLSTRRGAREAANLAHDRAKRRRHPADGRALGGASWRLRRAGKVCGRRRQLARRDSG